MTRKMSGDSPPKSGAFINAFAFQRLVFLCSEETEDDCMRPFLFQPRLYFVALRQAKKFKSILSGKSLPLWHVRLKGDFAPF